MPTSPMWLIKMPVRSKIIILTKAHALLLDMALTAYIDGKLQLSGTLAKAAQGVWSAKVYLEKEVKRDDNR